MRRGRVDGTFFPPLISFSFSFYFLRLPSLGLVCSLESDSSSAASPPFVHF